MGEHDHSSDTPPTNDHEDRQYETQSQVEQSILEEEAADANEAEQVGHEQMFRRRFFVSTPVRS
ncbi:hypothetical protein [Halorussus amylolyticus]|uniref:hypothetical protein n=1 Tax=Halorussus amylolyticus TaxID=1126242 RepID=UPI0010519F86|nr:hypothetical protein [Halorussus amylolyticus]